jgi:predicted amidohydrolase
MNRPTSLTVGVAQPTILADLWANAHDLVRIVGNARAKRCDVVVFPEGALYAPPDTPKADIDAAVMLMRQTAASHRINIVLGLCYRQADDEPQYQRLLVIGRDGGIIQAYDKMWADTRFNELPGVFEIDGVPCHAAICADRWIRAVEELPVFQGSQIMFECSNNYYHEWVPDLGWYWYVPRALRNGVYVVFCNSPRESPSRKAAGHGPGHGHSAIVDPAGRLVVSAGEETDALLVATLDLTKADRAEALRRKEHALLAPFWDAGVRILSGQHVEAVAYEPLVSPPLRLTLAAAQVACQSDATANVRRMAAMVRQAKAGGADLVALPELAVTGAAAGDILRADRAILAQALADMRDIAATERAYVVFGMPRLANDATRYNAAYALGPQGEVLTCYDQLVVDRPELFSAGASTRAMWFEVNGAPAVVTIGRDALWNELAELAGVRGAQVHVHLSYGQDVTPQGALLRRQLWANLATYYTFTVTANAAAPDSRPLPSALADGRSVIWQDFRSSEMRTRTVGGRRFCCPMPVAEAGPGEEIIYATETLPTYNRQFGAMVTKTSPQMAAWYRKGAMAIYSPSA